MLIHGGLTTIGEMQGWVEALATGQFSKHGSEPQRFPQFPDKW